MNTKQTKTVMKRIEKNINSLVETYGHEKVLATVFDVLSPEVLDEVLFEVKEELKG